MGGFPWSKTIALLIISSPGRKVWRKWILAHQWFFKCNVNLCLSMINQSKRPSEMWIFAYWFNPPRTNVRQSREIQRVCLSVSFTSQDFTWDFFFCGDLREGEVAQESILMRCLSMLVIVLLGVIWIMLALAKFPDTKPGDLAWHRFSKPKSQMQCESLLVINSGRIPSGPRKIWKEAGLFYLYLSVTHTRPSLTKCFL